MPTTTANAKGTVSFKAVSPKLQFDSKSFNGQVTLKHKKGDVTTSVQFTDKTAKDVNSLNDIVLTFDYKYNPELTFSGSYDFNNYKHKLSGQWTGKVNGKAASVKTTYTEKDGAVVTELKASLVKDVAGEVTFNKASLKSAKGIISKGGLAFEPSFNFVSQSPSLTVTKKFKKQGVFKLAYDVKDESASLEWNKHPFKVTAVSKVTATNKNPNVSVIYEKLYHI